MKWEAAWEVARGKRITAAELARARRIRDAWRAEVTELLRHDYDALALPAAQVFPFDAAWRHPASVAGRQMDTYHRWMECVVPASLGGLPALCVPAGFGGKK